MKTVSINKMAEEVAKRVLNDKGIHAASAFMVVAYHNSEDFRNAVIASGMSALTERMKDLDIDRSEMDWDVCRETVKWITDRIFGAEV